MPQGPEDFVSDTRYGEEFAQAKGLVLEHPGRWRVIYHYDGDGIASASSALRAFARLGYPTQATALLGVERERMADLMRATSGPLLVVDTGASWLDLLAEHPHPVVVLDHHRYSDPPPRTGRIAHVNPLDWGTDGMSEMCAATLTWLFTIHLDGRNWDNAPWGLSGAIADRQHVGGFRGLNAELVREAIHRSLITSHRGLALRGRNVATALETSVDPFVRGISGHPEGVRDLLAGLAIDGNRPPQRLAPEEEDRLAQALMDRLRASGVNETYTAMVRRERWWIPSLGMDAEELADLQNACGRAGEPGTGVAIALGDAAAVDRAQAAEERWRRGLLEGLLRLEAGGINSMRSLQWFESPETTLAGTQAGLAMNYLLDPQRPVFAFSHEGAGPIKVSGRGTTELVARGLDLASACRTAAQEVRGEGGGHRIASGATIPDGSRDAFLAVLDREIAGQLAPRPSAGAAP